MLETKLYKKSNLVKFAFSYFGATCVVYENENWWKEVNVKKDLES